MTAFTGLPELVIAFDYDGVLTSAAVPGSGGSVKIDLTPLVLALDAGCRVAVMTCNDVSHVAGVLESRGIPALQDRSMRYALPPEHGRVLVSNRKVVADLYVDDHGMRWSYGDDLARPTCIFDLARPARA